MAGPPNVAGHGVTYPFPTTSHPLEGAYLFLYCYRYGAKCYICVFYKAPTNRKKLALKLQQLFRPSGGTKNL